MGSGWRKNYIRGFIAMVGFVFLFVGVVTSRFLGEGINFGKIFSVIGVIFVIVAAYLWYKDSQGKS